MRHGDIVFVEIPVRDLGRAGGFCAALFGWAFEEDAENPRRWLFAPDGAGAMGAITTERPIAQGVRICVAASDLAAVMQRIVTLGGAPVGSPPKSDVGSARELVDPDRNHLWIVAGQSAASSVTRPEARQGASAEHVALRPSG